MLVNLARFPVFPEQTTQNPLSPHPLNLGGEPSLCGTLPLTGTGVTTLALSGKQITGPCAGVDDIRLDDDRAVLDELLDMGTGVGVADLSLVAGVKPDFAFTDAGDGCGEPLLRAKVDHCRLLRVGDVSGLVVWQEIWAAFTLKS